MTCKALDDPAESVGRVLGQVDVSGNAEGLDHIRLELVSEREGARFGEHRLVVRAPPTVGAKVTVRLYREPDVKRNGVVVQTHQTID